MVQPTVFQFFPLHEIRPDGWLRKQLECQRDGLSGHLDTFWPDIKDSRWIGGILKMGKNAYWLVACLRTALFKYSHASGVYEWYVNNVKLFNFQRNASGASLLNWNGDAFNINKTYGIMLLKGVSLTLDNSSAELSNAGFFRGKYKASDGTAPATGTLTFREAEFGFTVTIFVKDGICTALSMS